MPASSSLFGDLRQPGRYRERLRRLRARAKGRDHALSREGVTLDGLYLDPRGAARSIAAEVAAGSYAVRPARIRRALLDKPRDLFVLDATDLVVHGAVSGVLTEAMEAHLSPCVHSYRGGRSPAGALRAFGAYLRAHRREVQEPRERGLYVLRADVKSYGETIPLGASSPLWDRLREVLGPVDRDQALWALLGSVIRPEVMGEAGPWQPIVGIPTGSPVATALANLYLMPLDRSLEAVPGGFYARFGDDLLFAHPDPGVARQAVATTHQILTNLQLGLNPDKERFVFFNGAGRPSSHGAVTGTTAVRYVGARIGFDGTVGLSKDKAAHLLRDLRARLERTAGLLGDAPLEERARALCATANGALDPVSPLCSRYAPLVAHAVDDRRQLRQLDYWIARAVASALAGRGDVRAFRHVPYRSLRQRWGLGSLVVRANRRGRRT
jgi:hypothetical protein